MLPGHLPVLPVHEGGEIRQAGFQGDRGGSAGGCQSGRPGVHLRGGEDPPRGRRGSLSGGAEEAGGRRGEGGRPGGEAKPGEAEGGGRGKPEAPGSLQQPAKAGGEGAGDFLISRELKPANVGICKYYNYFLQIRNWKNP